MYRYVTKRELKKLRNEISKYIVHVHRENKKDFTFADHFVGSSSRNMVVVDDNLNKGYDIDISFTIINNKAKFDNEIIKKRIMKSLEIATEDGFVHPEDSSRVITVKKIDKENSKIINSFDLSIAYKDSKTTIVNDKKTNNYIENEQALNTPEFNKKILWIKKENLWNDLRKKYLHEKNNSNNNKESYQIFKDLVEFFYSKK